MTAWCRASGRAGAGDRLLDRRVAPAGRADRARQARRKGRSPVRSWSRCSTATASPTISAWSRRCAAPASAPSFISATRRTISAQQLKYADKRGSPCAIIQGGDEKGAGEVQIKDLIARRRARRNQGPRRIPEEAGRGAIRRQGNGTGRGRARPARKAQTGLKNSGFQTVTMSPSTR